MSDFVFEATHLLRDFIESARQQAGRPCPLARPKRILPVFRAHRNTQHTRVRTSRRGIWKNHIDVEVQFCTLTYVHRVSG
jgi:hypothetical protein